MNNEIAAGVARHYKTQKEFDKMKRTIRCLPALVCGLTLLLSTRGTQGQLTIVRDFDPSVSSEAGPAIHAAAIWWEQIIVGRLVGELVVELEVPITFKFDTFSTSTITITKLADTDGNVRLDIVPAGGGDSLFHALVGVADRQTPEATALGLLGGLSAAGVLPAGFSATLGGALNVIEIKGNMAFDCLCCLSPGAGMDGACIFPDYELVPGAPAVVFLGQDYRKDEVIDTSTKAATAWSEMPTGLPGAATITFNSALAPGWFFDLTPHSSTGEFDGAGNAFPNGPAANKCDLRTVAKHEIGHALGFEAKSEAGVGVVSPGFEKFNICINATGQWTCGGIMAQMVGGGGLNNRSHLKSVGTQVGDLMTPDLGFGERRDQSVLDVEMLSAAFGYVVTPSAHIPTVSEWGLMVMTVLLLTAGALILGRKRRAASVA